MCIIIYKPKDQEITKSELSEAWDTNPHGGGFAYVEEGAVTFKRGYMNKAKFIKAVMALQDKDLIIHMRISTCSGINQQGTHPYKAGAVNRLSGVTTYPVIAMNGIISGQALKTFKGAKLNDTASFILDHVDTFKVINQDILNILEDYTGSKWAVATPSGVIISKGFIESKGLYYSNLNHKSLIYALGDYIYEYSNTRYVDVDPKDHISPNIYKTAPADLLWDLEDYVYIMCSKWKCKDCKGCIYDLETTKEAKQFIDKNYGNVKYGGY